MFNEGRYWENTQDGTFSAVVKKSRHPSLPLANEPHCTYSQHVLYVDGQGLEVARVHQYLRPDGSIGLSGKPDPKMLVKDGKMYRITKASAAMSQE